MFYEVIKESGASFSFYYLGQDGIGQVVIWGKLESDKLRWDKLTCGRITCKFEFVEQFMMDSFLLKLTQFAKTGSIGEPYISLGNLIISFHFRN